MSDGASEILEPQARRRAAWREAAQVAVISLVLAFAFTWRVFVGIDNWGIYDWDQHLFFQEVPRVSILEYGQVPLWNPYYVGGTVMLANPQSRILSPTYACVLLLGTERGIKVELFLHAAILLASTYALARHLGLRKLGAWLAAFVYSLSGLYAFPATFGMSWVFALGYLPLALLGFRKSLEHRRWIWLTGLALTLQEFAGAPYLVAITALVLGLDAVVSSATRRSFAPCLRLAEAVAIFVALAAVKLVPQTEFLRAHPRTIDDMSGYSVLGLVMSLMDRSQYLRPMPGVDPPDSFSPWSGMSYNHDENLMYVGIAPVALALIGLVLRGRRHAPLVVCGIGLLWLSLGNLTSPSLWSAVHQLPVFDSMRVAQRFRFGWMLVLAVFAGFGLQALEDLVARRAELARRVRWGAIAITLGVLVDLLLVNGWVFRWAFTVEPDQPRPMAKFRQTSSLAPFGEGRPLGPDAPAWANVVSMPLLFGVRCNLGQTQGDESMNVVRAAFSEHDPGYKGEAFLTTDTGRAEVEKWTPNRVRVVVSVIAEERLALNQNFDPGWRCADGRPVEKWGRGGLVSVAVKPGDRTIEFVYRPTSVFVGLAVSAAAMLFAAYLFVARPFVARRRLAGAPPS